MRARHSGEKCGLNIWSACDEQIKTVRLEGELVRVVESQEQIATNKIVDDLNEQAILEGLLENTKPPIPASAQHLHYLLYTPFRYPPLKYGSRFGARFESSLFYSSRNLPTALAETAYYRLLFWTGMSEPPSSGQLTTQHTAFTVTIMAEQGLQLQSPPFSQYQQKLTNKSSYTETQLLGSAMRENGVEAFEYLSARNENEGLNIALFTPDVIQDTAPTTTVNLICKTDGEGVMFIDDNKDVYQYAMSSFTEDGQFPLPVR